MPDSTANSDENTLVGAFMNKTGETDSGLANRFLTQNQLDLDAAVGHYERAGATVTQLKDYCDQDDVTGYEPLGLLHTVYASDFRNFNPAQNIERLSRSDQAHPN